MQSDIVVHGLISDWFEGLSTFSTRTDTFSCQKNNEMLFTIVTILTFCTSFKTTGLLSFIPGNGDSRERCVPPGTVLSDCNLRSGSSGPALQTGKNTPTITGGCGQTKNVTEPLLQFPGQTVAISTNHELRGRFSSNAATPWLDQSTL